MLAAGAAWRAALRRGVLVAVLVVGVLAGLAGLPVTGVQLLSTPERLAGLYAPMEATVTEAGSARRAAVRSRAMACCPAAFGWTGAALASGRTGSIQRTASGWQAL